MMDDAPQKPSAGRRFLRSYRGRMAIALILIVVVLLAQITLIAIPYQREQRIAEKIQSLGGIVQYEYHWASWIPRLLLNNLPICGGVSSVSLTTADKPLPSELLAEIASLRKLKTLWLLGPQVTDDVAEKLKGMTNLTGLYLGDNQITDKGVEYLKGLTGLEWLFLIKTQVSDQGLMIFQRLTSLKSICLMDNMNVTDVGMENLKGLTGLEILNVEGTDVSDDGLKHFVGMTSLKQLDLGKTLVTEEGKTRLRQALPSCTVGSLSARTPKRTRM